MRPAACRHLDRNHHTGGELIQCTERGKTRIKDSEELMDCLYREDGSDCEGIVTDCRVSEARFPVLTAVANLYLKQQVTFQIL